MIMIRIMPHIYLFYRFILQYESLKIFNSINPLWPWVTNSSRIAKISISKYEGIMKKISHWATRLWVGRRKEPILGYVPKNDKNKKNSGSKGLNGHEKLIFSAAKIDILPPAKVSSMPPFPNFLPTFLVSVFAEFYRHSPLPGPLTYLLPSD